MHSPWALLPFPGPPADGLVSGLTPPHDEHGCPLDLRTPESHLPTLRTRLEAESWPAYWLRQVHGADVEVVHSRTEPGLVGGADALVTDQPGALLITRHADCPPVLIWDSHRRALGLVHSGRRGTLANVASAVVGCMVEQYGSDPREIAAHLGPGIRGCCYEVGEEIRTEATRLGWGDEYFDRRFGSTYMDLQKLLRDQLRAAGVGTVYGEQDAECTRCGPTQMHSYRRAGSKVCFAAVAGILP